MLGVMRWSVRSYVGGNGDVEGVSWLCQVQAALVLMCLDIGDGGGDSEIDDSVGGHEVVRSCVCGNGDVEGASWLCQVQAALVLMSLDMGDGGVQFRYFVLTDIVVMVICHIATET